jgi:hypothetical protein
MVHRKVCRVSRGGMLRGGNSRTENQNNEELNNLYSSDFIRMNKGR